MSNVVRGLFGRGSEADVIDAAGEPAGAPSSQAASGASVDQGGAKRATPGVAPSRTVLAQRLKDLLRVLKTGAMTVVRLPASAGGAPAVGALLERYAQLQERAAALHARLEAEPDAVHQEIETSFAADVSGFAGAVDAAATPAVEDGAHVELPGGLKVALSPKAKQALILSAFALAVGGAAYYAYRQSKKDERRAVRANPKQLAGANEDDEDDEDDDEETEAWRVASNRRRNARARARRVVGKQGGSRGAAAKPKPRTKPAANPSARRSKRS